LACCFVHLVCHLPSLFSLPTLMLSSYQSVTLTVAPAAGGANEELVADVVLVATGRRPNTKDLGLDVRIHRHTQKTTFQQIVSKSSLSGRAVANFTTTQSIHLLFFPLLSSLTITYLT
jgi:hypothetical protein